MSTFFETERLVARKLRDSDLEPFHKMQSNINVMQYVKGKAMTFEENRKDLLLLIEKYDFPENDFWIYAIERKRDDVFVGTVALVKDKDKEDEIGYRLLEKYWGKGYGMEIAKGLVMQCKKLGLPRIIACVAHKNKASTRIIEKLGFTFVEDFISEDLKLPERKFLMKL